MALTVAHFPLFDSTPTALDFFSLSIDWWMNYLWHELERRNKRRRKKAPNFSEKHININFVCLRVNIVSEIEQRRHWRRRRRHSKKSPLSSRFDFPLINIRIPACVFGQVCVPQKKSMNFDKREKEIRLDAVTVAPRWYVKMINERLGMEHWIPWANRLKTLKVRRLERVCSSGRSETNRIETTRASHDRHESCSIGVGENMQIDE